VQCLLNSELNNIKITLPFSLKVKVEHIGIAFHN